MHCSSSGQIHPAPNQYSTSINFADMSHSLPMFLLMHELHYCTISNSAVAWASTLWLTSLVFPSHLPTGCAPRVTQLSFSRKSSLNSNELSSSNHRHDLYTSLISSLYLKRVLMAVCRHYDLFGTVPLPRPTISHSMIVSCLNIIKYPRSQVYVNTLVCSISASGLPYVT